MGKTLIINGADFSDVSIGKVKILSEKALEWIAASGNSGLTTEQKFAIDDFISAVGVTEANSVWSKIDRFWLPMIAGDKAHSLVDYKNGYANAYSSLSTNSKASFDDYVSFSDKGLKVASSGSGRAAVVVDDAYTFSSQDSSFFVFNTSVLPTLASGSTTDLSGIGGSSGANKQFGMTLTATAVQNKYLTNTVLKYDTSIGFRNQHLRGVASNSTGLSLLCSDGTFASSAAVTSETLTGISILRGASPYLNDKATPSYGAFIVGKYLTDTQVGTLRTAIDDLFAALSV